MTLLIFLAQKSVDNCELIWQKSWFLPLKSDWDEFCCRKKPSWNPGGPGQFGARCSSWHTRAAPPGQIFEGSDLENLRIKSLGQNHGGLDHFLTMISWWKLMSSWNEHGSSWTFDIYGFLSFISRWQFCWIKDLESIYLYTLFACDCSVQSQRIKIQNILRAQTPKFKHYNQPKSDEFSHRISEYHTISQTQDKFNEMLWLQHNKSKPRELQPVSVSGIQRSAV